MKIYQIDSRKLIPITQPGYQPGQEQAKTYFPYLPRTTLKSFFIEPDADMIPDILRMVGIDDYVESLSYSVIIPTLNRPYLTLYYLGKHRVPRHLTVSHYSENPQDYDLANQILAITSVYQKKEE